MDEAFLDVRGCEGLFGAAPEIARKLKERIKNETGLVASVGVAPNKFLAKLASDFRKPDGLVVTPVDGITDFLAPLLVGRIWGVGAKAEKRLHALGLRTIGQVAAAGEKLLVSHFGEMGRHVWRLAHGEDERTVVPDREAKSISTETTFEQDSGDRDTLRAWMLDLTDHLASRLRHAGLQARTIELKIRSSDFRTRHRAQALSQPTELTDVIWKTALEVFDRGVTEEVLPLRLLGVGASRLTRDNFIQGDLFDAGQHERQKALDGTIDAIRGQFGGHAIQRGILLYRNADEEFK